MKIANNGQRFFPVIKDVPNNFETCLLQFEVAYFYKHIGFTAVSIRKGLIV